MQLIAKALGSATAPVVVSGGKHNKGSKKEENKGAKSGAASDSQE